MYIDARHKSRMGKVLLAFLLFYCVSTGFLCDGLFIPGMDFYLTGRWKGILSSRSQDQGSGN